MVPRKRATKKPVAKKSTALTLEVRQLRKKLVLAKRQMDQAVLKGSPLASDEVADCASVRDLVQAGQAYLAEHCPIV